MKKINLIRIYLLLIIFLWLGSIVSAATSLNFMGINVWSINQKFSPVAFKAGGNDFIWSIFWLNTKNIETWEVIKINGDSDKTCFKQVRWIYYNAQRWNRIWPLDQDTLKYFIWLGVGNYNDLSMSGWLYTSCSGDEYSIYGQVAYHVSWDSFNSHVTAWVKYNRGNNNYSWSFAKSLQRFDNKFPLGFIHDDRWWGIWFVWWAANISDLADLITKLNNGSWINNIFGYGGTNHSNIEWLWISINTKEWNAINTLMNAWVRWTVWLSFSVNTVEKNTILWNFDRKTLIFNALNINFSKLINEVRKNTENVCKWKYEDFNDYNVVNYFNNKNLFCLDFSSDNINNRHININQSDRTVLKNKTIVVKNWDIRIDWWMTTTDWPVNIFIDKWNLLIKDNISSAVGFDGNWYVTTTNSVTKWINLKGNFIINGLIIWADTSRNKTAFTHKLFFNGKLASLNTPSYASDWRKEQIKNMFASTDYNDRIRLGKVFTRECNPITWSWNDNGQTPCNNSWDKNALLPLIIVDGNYKFF